MIRHIAAIDKHRGIAKNGVQPWKLLADEQYFAEMTKQHGGVLLMGRTTFETIGRPLPDRQNFVLTRNQDYTAGGVTVVHDLESFLRTHEDVWVIGGAQLYAATLDQADELYLTHIDADLGCDTFYPDYTDSFQLSSQQLPLHENELTFTYAIYATKRL